MSSAVPILVGAALPFVVGVFAIVTGLDRDRAFYPLVMIVIASLYMLFALLGGSTEALLLDGAIASVFIVAAVVGFKKSLWVVVVALAAHGVMDLFHGSLVANPGVPTWYPAFCLTYDVVAAGFLAGLLLWRKSEVARPVSESSRGHTRG